VLQSGSPLTVSNMLKNMAKERSETLEAYARVLLNWYTNEKYFISRRAKRRLEWSRCFLKP
jgi:hypothetical protein